MQTPVLAMIVRRDDEIRTFKPEPFWELLTRYREVTFKFAGDRFAQGGGRPARSSSGCEGHPFAVRGVERKPERVQPPQLYDLTELQRDMNRRYGLSADATLKAAQSLYEAKLISYPRTDSRYLGGDMKGKVPGILDELRPLKPAEIGKLDLDALAFTGRIINDAKVSDHHAIIPTGKQPGALSPAAAEGLRRRRHPPDRRLLPGLREGGDDRRRGVERGAVPGPGRAGARAGLDRPVPPQGRRQEGRRAGAARVPPRRERPARAVRPAGRDDAAEALHRGDACSGRWRRPASWSTTSS